MLRLEQQTTKLNISTHTHSLPLPHPFLTSHTPKQQHCINKCNMRTHTHSINHTHTPPPMNCKTRKKKKTHLDLSSTILLNGVQGHPNSDSYQQISPYVAPTQNTTQLPPTPRKAGRNTAVYRCWLSQETFFISISMHYAFLGRAKSTHTCKV